MAVSRVFSQSRLALSRGFATRCHRPIFYTTSIALSRRQFSSSLQAREEFVQKPAAGSGVPITSTNSAALENNYKQSIAITKLPWNTVPADVEALLRHAGVAIKHLQFRIDRFTFQSDTNCFVQLESEEQVQRAVKALHGHQLEQRKVRVSPLNDTFRWDETRFDKDRRMFVYGTNTPFEAIQGLLEGRRYALFVEQPGWPLAREKGQQTDKSANVQRKEIIDKYLGPYGVEAIGMLQPIWKKTPAAQDTFVTVVEFSSKEGAQRAVEALHGQQVEGKTVFLRPAEISPHRAQQIGRVDKSLLAQLEQHSLLAPEPAPEAKV